MLCKCRTYYLLWTYAFITNKYALTLKQGVPLLKHNEANVTYCYFSLTYCCLEKQIDSVIVP